MSTAEHKDVVRRFYAEVIADGMIAEAVDVVASGELVAQLTAP